MKKKLLAILCALVLIMGLPATACASDIVPRASDYFSCTSVRAYATGNGKVLVEVGVDATHMMDEVGASYVIIYKELSYGSYEKVYTFSKDTTSGMIVENSFFGYVDVTYQGVPGERYYAMVGCYAKDSNGSETLFFNTNIVTA